MAKSTSHPGARESLPELQDHDPVGHIVEVDIARIQPYEHNPRHSPNPEYDRIQDSIRNNGLDQPLVITQRPGARRDGGEPLFPGALSVPAMAPRVRRHARTSAGE